MDTGVSTPGTSVFSTNGISSWHAAPRAVVIWETLEVPCKGTDCGTAQNPGCDSQDKWHRSVATAVWPFACSPTTFGCQVQSRYACAREERGNSSLSLGKTGSTGLGVESSYSTWFAMAYD